MTHLSVSEERRNGVSQRGKYREELLRSQQGELNAVLMYQRLAKVVKTDKEREAFLSSHSRRVIEIWPALNNIIKSEVHFYLVFFLVSKMFRIFAIKSTMFL